MQRFFEILPATLAWLTLVLMVVLSWLTPTAVSIFIIVFDIYWLLKTVYLSFHLRSTFSQMRANLALDWLEKLRRDFAGTWGGIHHLVVLPMYDEPYAVVRETFESLAKTNYPKEKVFIVLATEARAGKEAAETAERIKAEFAGSFGELLVVAHPAGLSGELPGKGSNETWAAREAKKLIVDKRNLSPDEVLVSVFDVDTQVFPNYFGRLAHAFLGAPNRLRTIYQPIPFFTNNIFEAPALARVVSFSATFWQMMQQSRPERLTSFSSQAIPLRALMDMGFWEVDVVSEDSRVFWQGYLRYQGDFRCVPLFYPVSMDANVAPKFWQTMKNIYKQQRRWAWGVENTPYLLDGFFRKVSKIPLRTRLYWAFTDLEGRHSWATNAIMIFALGWLPVMLGGKAFNDTLLSYNLPEITRFIVNLSMIGVATSAILSLILLPPRPQDFGRSRYLWYFIQWALLPLTLIIFGCVPALEAQTRLAVGGKWRLGFWVTPKGRYAQKAR